MVQIVSKFLIAGPNCVGQLEPDQSKLINLFAEPVVEFNLDNVTLFEQSLEPTTVCVTVTGEFQGRTVDLKFETESEGEKIYREQGEPILVNLESPPYQEMCTIVFPSLLI